MYRERVELYRELEKEFDSKILVYVTSDRPNMAAQISPDVIDYFIDHLDKIKPCGKISLFLYTRGGDTSTARNIVNLLRMYGDTLQVIIPHKARSAGTIISLGANEIVMTKQATLGPIDPSLYTARNPRRPEGGIFPVSVEAVKGYLEFAKNELGLKIVNPTAFQYELIKKVYDDMNEELLFGKPFLITEVNGAYAVRRCILESVVGGADYFSTEGVVVRGKMPDGQTAIQNNVNYEGWRHDHASDGDQIQVKNGEEEVIYERGSEYQTKQEVSIAI